jgi:uncharacterized membrane protein
MNKRLRIRLNLTPSDYFWEIVGAVGIVCLVVLPLCYYSKLPVEIPGHFNLLGQVDAYGKRETIWLLPGVGLFLYVGLTVLNRYPWIFNYPVKVTKDNAPNCYRTGTRIIRMVKVFIVLLFLFLTFKTIHIAMGA